MLKTSQKTQPAINPADMPTSAGDLMALIENGDEQRERLNAMSPDEVIAALAGV
jgi:hypothetical protein